MISCFEMIFNTDDNEEPIGFLLGLDEDGAYVWFDTNKVDLDRENKIRIRFPLLFQGPLDLKYRSIYFAEASEENFRKVICNFIGVTEDDKLIIKKLMKELDFLAPLK